MTPERLKLCQMAESEGKGHLEEIARYMRRRVNWPSLSHHYANERIEYHAERARYWFSMARRIQNKFS